MKDRADGGTTLSYKVLDSVFRGRNNGNDLDGVRTKRNGLNL